MEASKELHLTSSALSHGLKGLESDLGCRLFERVGRKMLLNEAGEQLLAKIERPLTELDEAEQSMKRLQKWGQTRLRIGAAASACQHIVPGVIRELRKRFPKLTLQIESGDTADMVKLIQTNKVDLALGVAPEGRTADLEMRPVFKDELLFVFSSSHPWAEGKPISRDELRRQPLIFYQRASLTRKMVEEFFESMEVTPSTVMEIGNMEAIKELVKLNLGVSVLAPWTVDKELAKGALKMRPIGPKPMRRQWVIAWLKGRRLTLAEETFCGVCRSIASGFRMERSDLPPL